MGKENDNKKTPATYLFVDMIRILQAQGFVSMSSDAQIEGLASFIGYRSQLALYEILTETEKNVAWEDFVLAVRKSPQIREAIQAVAIHAVVNFDLELLDFELPKDALEYIDETDSDEQLISVSRIFSKEIGELIVQFFLFKAETQQFSNISKSNSKYSWRRYLDDLEGNGELWNKLSRAFQHGLRQIDFKASWKNDDIKETKFLREPF